MEKKGTANAHFVCLMYNKTSSSKDTAYLSMGFHRSIDYREKKLTIDKTIKKIYCENLLERCFWFCRALR